MKKAKTGSSFQAKQAELVAAENGSNDSSAKYLQVTKLLEAWWHKAHLKSRVQLVRHLARALLGSDWTAKDVQELVLELIAAFQVGTAEGEGLVSVAEKQRAEDSCQEWFEISTRDTSIELGAHLTTEIRSALGLGLPSLLVGTPVEIAHHALVLLERTGPVVFDGVLWQYNRMQGIWIQVPGAALERIIQQFDGVPIGESGKPTKVTQTLATQTQLHLSVAAARTDFFADAVAGISFTNGFLRIEKAGAVLETHRAKNKARWQLDFDYDPSAPCPRFDRFLDEVFQSDDLEARKECAQEFVGAALTGQAPSYEKALFLLGDGRNGKGVFCEVIQWLFPKGSISKVSPLAFEDKHRRIQLHGALLNIVTELRRVQVTAPDMFKAIVSGEAIDGAHPHRPRVEFRPQAAHIYSTNDLPIMTEDTNGLWSRVLVLLRIPRMMGSCSTGSWSPIPRMVVRSKRRGGLSDFGVLLSSGRSL